MSRATLVALVLLWYACPILAVKSVSFDDSKNKTRIFDRYINKSELLSDQDMRDKFEIEKYDPAEFESLWKNEIAALPAAKAIDLPFASFKIWARLQKELNHQLVFKKGPTKYCLPNKKTMDRDLKKWAEEPSTLFSPSEKAINLSHSKFKEWAKIHKPSAEQPSSNNKKQTLAMSQYVMPSGMLIGALIYSFLLYSTIEQAVQN